RRRVVARRRRPAPPRRRCPCRRASFRPSARMASRPARPHPAMTQATYEYSRQDAAGATCTAHAWAKVMPTPGPDERARLKARAKQLLKANDAVLVAHYYVDGDLQDLALETGGCVADSLEMARFGRAAAQQTLVVAGVRFMGETSKILSP